MFELQQENQGRAADRRAELNRQVHNPSSVRRWDEVPGAINTWEAIGTEYTCLTGQTLAEETKIPYSGFFRSPSSRLRPRNMA